MNLNLLFALVLLAILNPLSIYAQEAANPQDAALAKMRQVLRDDAARIQTAENSAVTLQAQVTQDEADKKDLQARLDAATAQLKTVSDQAVADKADSSKQITDLKADVDDKTGQIARLNDGIKQWKTAYDATAQLAAGNEAARKQYAIQAATLQRTVDDREAKNLALYKLATEILTRYEKFGLGEALEAKEPFVGLSRVKLETLVQDYKNKILDQAVTSGQPVTIPAPKATTQVHAVNPNPPAVPATSDLPPKIANAKTP